MALTAHLQIDTNTDEQDTTILKGNELYLPGEERKPFGIVDHIDPIARMIEVQKRGDTADPASRGALREIKAYTFDHLGEILVPLGKWVLTMV